MNSTEAIAFLNGQPTSNDAAEGPCSHCGAMNWATVGFDTLVCGDCGWPEESEPVVAVCRLAIDSDGARLTECGGQIVSRWMETRRCEHGHYTAVLS